VAQSARKIAHLRNGNLHRFVKVACCARKCRSACLIAPDNVSPGQTTGGTRGHDSFLFRPVSIGKGRRNPYVTSETDWPMMTDIALKSRPGLPEPLRVLLHDYPRDGWTADANFDGLVRFWLERHMSFRELMVRFHTETEAVLDHNADPQNYGRRLSRLGGFFLENLHGHHTIEDAHFFPALADKDARITSGFAILESDHQAIDGHLSRFVSGANAVLRSGDDRAALQTAAGAFGEILADLDALLDRHLTDEEELIVPVLLKFGTEGL
jgi:iron-sulfur cluster repair protein YtfE (RIC family)